MPEFAAVLQFPLGNEYYDVMRLKEDLEDGKDSVTLEIISDSVLIRITDNESVIIGDDLKTDPVNDATSGNISNDLRVLDSVTVNMHLAFLAPPVIDAMNGINDTIPAFSFNTPYTVVNGDSNTRGFSQFTATTAYSGSVRLTFTNNTQASFDSIRVVVFNKRNRVRLDSFTLILPASPLNSGASRTVNRTFSAPADTIMQDSITIRLSGHSTGTTGSVLINTASSLSVLVRPNITSSAITGRFLSQTILKSDSVTASTSSDVDSAYVDRGRLNLSFVSTLPVRSSVTFTDSEFVTAAGVPLSQTFVVNAGATVNTFINMANFRLVPKWTTTNALRNLHYRASVHVDSSTSLATTIQNGNGMSVTATIDTLRFSRMRGTLNNEDVTISSRSQDINIKYLDSIQVQTAYFEIITEHRIPFQMNVNMNLVGKRGSRSQATVVSGIIQKHSGGPNPQRDTLLTPVGSYPQVAALLSLVPDSIYVSGTALVGNNSDNGIVTKSDSLVVRVNLRAPMRFRLPNDPNKNLIRPDPSELDIAEDTRKDIYDNLKEMRISGTIVNHFPVPVEVQFIIDSNLTPNLFYDNNGLFLFPTTPLIIAAGTTNANGIVTAPTTTTLDCTLTQDRFRKAFQPNVPGRYRGFKARLRGTTGSPYVRVSATDYLDVDVSMEVEVQLDEDFP